jgi:hypothetical protein
MKRISGYLAGLAGLAAMGSSAAALADNPLGLYIGVGAGVGQVGNDYGYYDPYGYGGRFHDHDAAWKVIAGLRPISLVGAEIEYIDFGNARGNDGYYYGNYDYSVSAHPKATVVYGIGYLPLPLPFLDVYGKLGVARLQTDNSYYTPVGDCTAAVQVSCPAVGFRFDEQNTKFAYGAGVQTKFQDFAFRAEYERISSPYGDPNAFTVSVTWTF